MFEIVQTKELEVQIESYIKEQKIKELMRMMIRIEAQIIESNFEVIIIN